MTAPVDTATMPPTHPPMELRLNQVELDPSMQCRAGGVQEAIVAEYGQAMREGVTFPPIRLVHVGNQLLLVDGWHRHAAAVWAGLKTIWCLVEPGTRRSALLEAVKANSTHGLQRTQADKRRAVKLLLMDAEWSGLSSRELAGLAQVSHTYVDQLRKIYSVSKGEVLTDERASHVDGEAPAAWRELKAKAKWDAYTIEQIRTAAGPAELAGIHAYSGVPIEAQVMRREELASEPWPWSEDTTPAAIAGRLEGLDTQADLVAAARSTAITAEQREEVYKLLRLVGDLPTRTWGLDELAAQWQHRPALVAAVEDRRRVVAEEQRRNAAAAASRETKDPYELARRIHQLKADPEKQGWGFRDAVKEVREKLRPWDLHPTVRDGVLRDWMDPDRTAKTCLVPTCSGWVADGACTTCSTYQSSFLEETETFLGEVAKLLPHGGFGFQARTNRGLAEVTGDTLELLAELDAMRRDSRSTALHKWLDKAPGDLKHLFRRAASPMDEEDVMVFVTADGDES